MALVGVSRSKPRHLSLARVTRPGLVGGHAAAKMPIRGAHSSWGGDCLIRVWRRVS